MLIDSKTLTFINDMHNDQYNNQSSSSSSKLCKKVSSSCGCVSDMMRRSPGVASSNVPPFGSSNQPPQEMIRLVMTDSNGRRSLNQIPFVVSNNSCGIMVENQRSTTGPGPLWCS